MMGSDWVRLTGTFSPKNVSLVQAQRNGQFIICKCQFDTELPRVRRQRLVKIRSPLSSTIGEQIIRRNFWLRRIVEYRDQFSDGSVR